MPPLLTTKLYFPPARPNLVSRPRLVERLAVGLQGPLTLITAPAGYGKTTLISEWRERRRRDQPVAWLSLDAGDNDPTRFLTYLTAALEGIHPGLLDDTTLRLQSPQPIPPEAVLTPLINHLGDCPRDVVLALDDYHVITATAVHAALTFLLDHLPPRLHLVILTRADPPLPLARLRARGQLAEIRAEQLRFTLEEVTSFLQKTAGVALTPEDTAALAARRSLATQTASAWRGRAMRRMA